MLARTLNPVIFVAHATMLALCIKKCAFSIPFGRPQPESSMRQVEVQGVCLSQGPGVRDSPKPGTRLEDCDLGGRRLTPNVPFLPSPNRMGIHDSKSLDGRRMLDLLRYFSLYIHIYIYIYTVYVLIYRYSK